MSSKMNPRRFRSPFLINLPSEIIINILSRLPIRTIISCKCVCKQLLDLLSTPEFAASHLSLSTPGLLIRHLNMNRDLCHIFEFEDEFEFQHHNLHYNPVMKFDPRVSIGFVDAALWIRGSVNGLLLLCAQKYTRESYDTLYICNPITREYIALPRIEGIDKYSDFSEYGFGVSKISGQYKVVRFVHRNLYNHRARSHSNIRNFECLVYTVGTRSWRNIQPGPPFGHSDHHYFRLFLSGNLHGLVQDCQDSTNILISCFDLETESFKSFPPPPPPLDSPALGTLGILDDCLCFVDKSSQDVDVIVIWVMKEYGMGDSWTKQFVIANVQDFAPHFCAQVYPIKAFKDGEILLNWNARRLFYFSDKTETCEILDLVIQDQHGSAHGIPHRSSFLSLKSFDGENVISL